MRSSPHSPQPRPSGFSLVEVMVATTIFVVAAVGLAPLLLLAARTTAGARATTYAAVLAREKMEQLRAEPVASGGGTGLSPSPPRALYENTPGYCEFLDANGRWLGAGTAPPAGTAFLRRWSISPLPASPDHVLVLQVLVTGLHTGAGAPGRARAPEEARIVSVKTRRAP
jgi:prepilin-type N-terminal cleavage/methylation domain-containing protein